MIRFVRRFAVVLLASFAIALPARATTYSVDFTDIWWNANEDGWGVTVTQQGEVVFATFFIYGPDRSARWFSAALFPAAGPVSVVKFSGDMFRSAGSFYGDATFTKDPAAKVGTATLTFNSATTGTLAYTIDGVAVTKQIVRQSFRGNNLAGNYFGGLISNRTNCNLMPFADATGDVTIAHTDSNVVIQVVFAPAPDIGACVFRGSYVPLGRVGTISNGTWSCTVGNTTAVQGINFTMTNIDGQGNGFHAGFIATDSSSCVYNGRMGGIRIP